MLISSSAGSVIIHEYREAGMYSTKGPLRNFAAARFVCGAGTR